jgi:hypothetical protein
MKDQKFRPEISADSKTGVVKIRVETDYGHVEFSYSPEQIAAGIATLVDDILHAQKTGERLNRIEQLGMSGGPATDAASLFKERANLTFPQSSIERFSPGSETYARGVVEHFSDNVIPAIALMLDYLAASALLSPSADTDPEWRVKVTQNRRSTLALLQKRLGEAIQHLYSHQKDDDSTNTR